MVERYRQLVINDTQSWARDVYGIELWEKQLEIIDSVFHYRRTAVKGCVASSKTLAAAMVVHAFVQAAAPAKIFSTAPTARQVDGVLWGDVRSLYGKAQARAVNLGGDLKPVASEWRFGADWFALGFSSNDPNRFHGWHGKNVLFIIDEAQGIDEPTMQAIENVMADGQARMLLLENPNVVQGVAYEAFHSQRRLWNCISIPASSTPNYKERKVVIPGMITYEQCEEWKKTYGADSDFYRVKVLADFPKQESDSLIPLSWVEQAWTRERKPNPTAIEIGGDVAYYGDDDSVAQIVNGNYCPKPFVLHGQDPMQLAAEWSRLFLDTKAKQINVDVIGIGAGVHHRLRQMGINSRAINVAESAINDVRFQNTRSEIAWGLREALDPQNPDAIALDRDDVQAAELIAVKYNINPANGKIKLEPKDDTKTRIGRSPDRFDALCLAVSGRIGSRRPAAAMSVGGVLVHGPTRPQPSWMGY